MCTSTRVPGGGLGGFGNASGGTKAGGGFSTHTAHEKKHQEAKSEAMRVTNDELKHVEATAKVRAPPRIGAHAVFTNIDTPSAAATIHRAGLPPLFASLPSLSFLPPTAASVRVSAHTPPLSTRTQRQVLAEVEKTRAPPYQKKIDLRKKLWQTMLGILEAGQVENQQLTAVGASDCY